MRTQRQERWEKERRTRRRVRFLLVYKQTSGESAEGAERRTTSTASQVVDEEEAKSR
jgi:hypothetical protein